MIKKYTRNFEGVEDAWIEVLHRTPVDIIKQLACTVEEFFNSYSSKKVSPLQIVAKKGTVHLFQYVISKVNESNQVCQIKDKQLCRATDLSVCEIALANIVTVFEDTQKLPLVVAEVSLGIEPFCKYDALIIYPSSKVLALDLSNEDLILL